MYNELLVIQENKQAGNIKIMYKISVSLLR